MQFYNTHYTQLYSQFMKKTLAEPEIRPLKKIAIPEKLAWAHQKSINQHNFFNTLEEIPMISKKEILLEANGIDLKSNKQRSVRSRAKSTIKTNQIKDTQIKVVNEFRALSRQNKEKKPVSVEKFKIKMTAAGFRRGKSVSNLRVNQSQKGFERNLKPQTSQQLPRGSSDLGNDNFDVIKAYYSFQSRKEEILKPRGQQIGTYQFRSERILQKSNEQVNLKQTPEILYKKSVQFQNIKKVDIGQIQKQKERKFSEYFLLKQHFSSSDFEYECQPESQELKFISRGFGVTNDLSKYDIDSLSDPLGVNFIKDNANKKAQCPYFNGQEYSWIKVIVVGYDQENNKVIIRKQGEKQLRKVNRLSLMFNNQQKEYWRRINQAKKLRATILEQVKYIGYIDNRIQMSEMMQFLSSEEIKSLKSYQSQAKQRIVNSNKLSKFSKDKLKLIQKQCHNRYYKQFLVFYQMWNNYEPFERMGFRYRQFIPFKVQYRYQRFKDFKKSKEMLEIYHYCSVTNMVASLKSIIEKIILQTQISFFHPFISANKCVNLEEFIKECKDLISSNIVKLIKQTREVLISDTIYKVRYSFGAEQRPVLKVSRGNDKNLEKRYLRLNNIIFRNEVETYYFRKNQQVLTDYLLKFQTWSKDKPNPIIHLEITINQNKQFCSVPTKEQCYLKICSTLQYLQECMNKVPDLTSDLLYETQKYMKVSLKKNSREFVKNVVQNSFKPINKYIESNNKYLKYLSTLRFNKQKFAQQAVQYYQSVLSQINEDLRQVLYYSLNKSGIFKISLEGSKTILKQQITINKQRISRNIQKQAIEQSNNMIKQLSKMQEQLKVVPGEQVSYVRLKKYVNVDCQNLLDDCRINLQLIGKFYLLLQQFCYEYRKKQFDRYMQIVLDMALVQKKLTLKKLELMDIQKRLLQKINQQREQIEKVIQESKQEIELIISLKKIDEYRDNFTSTSKLYYLLQQNCKKLENINFRQELLLQQLSIFPMLNRQVRRLEPYYLMWKNVYYFKAQSREWYELPIQQLNFEQIKLKIYETYKKEFTRLINIFKDNKNNDAQSICEAGSGLVQKLEQKFWMIESFTKEGLLKKPTMMSNILHKIYEADAPTNFKNVNLNDLVQHNVIEFKKFIVETAEKAQKIWNLEKRINLVINEIKSLHLEIGEKFGVNYIQPEVLVSLIMASKEQISLLEVIKSQDEAVDIIKRVTTVYSKVQTIQNTLQTIQQFLLKYIKIHRIFLINEIINELGEEKKKLNDVTRIWNIIVKHFNKDLQLWEAIDSDSHNHRMKDCIKLLQQIEQNLRKYLQSKRIIFPRLFFISDEELIEMIADEKYQIKSNKMKLLFNGTTKLILKSFNENKSCSIVGLQGSNRDSMKISRPVNSSVIIWDRLKQVHNQMIQTMQRNCNATGITDSKLLIIRMHHQVFKWTSKIEQRLRKGEKQPNYLHKLHESYYKQQMKSAGQAISQLKLKEHGEIYAWYCIKSVQLMLANILENLSKSSQNISTNSFEWQKCLRVYIQADKITPKIMTMVLPISYEYVGCDLSDFVYLFASPISNLHTVLTLMRIYCGSNAIGGDCKQTIKSLSMITFSHFVQQNLHISECSGELVYKLRGYYVQPILGLLNCKQSESLPTELISIIAQTAYQIRQAILLKQYAKVLAIDTKWDLNKGILNYGLQISFPLLNKNENANNSCGLLTLRLCFRDISLKKLSRNTFMEYFIQGLIGKENYSKIEQKMNGIFEELMVKNQTGLNYEFKKLMVELLSKMLVQMKTNEQFSLQIFLQNLLNCLLAYLPHNFHYEIKQRILSLNRIEQQEDSNNITKAFQYISIQDDQQVSQFLEVVQNLQSSKGYLNILAVVGPSLSGKTQLIRQALQRKGVQKQMVVQCASLSSYLTNSTEKLDHKYVILQSLYFGKSFESLQLQNTPITNLVPSSAFLIYQCRSLSSIGPSPLKIYHKKQINNWHHVMWRMLKLNLSKYLPVIEQFSRQMGILVRIIIYKLFGMSAKYHLTDTWMWEKNVEGGNTRKVNVIEEVWQIQSIFIKIVKNWINATTSLLIQGKIIESDLISVREGILICMIWTAKYDIEKLIDLASRRSKKINRVVIGQNILVDLSLKKEQIMKKIIYEYLINIQSSLLLKNDPNQTQLIIKKYNQMPNPYDFCYDIQKKAWLEWNVVDDLALYFTNIFQNFQQIYLPVVETSSIIYLTQNISNHFDLILMSESKGSGATTAIQKITQFHSTPSKAKSEEPRKEKRTKTETIKKTAISQYFSSMTCSSETISKMMDKIYVSRNKDGSYNAYKNNEVMIIVDDLEMISQREESGQKELCEFLTILTLFKTDMNKNKRLTNARNVFIASGVDDNLQSNPYLQRIFNSTILIYMRPISDESRISIFNYVLEWFFGNTDNPFSKEVRAMQKILVLLSVQLSNYHKQLYAQKNSILFKMRYADTNFKTLRIVFNYLCEVTPRWVKKQKEIIEAWVYQFSQVYPGLIWVDYLHIFDAMNIHIKKLPITRQQFIECVKAQVQNRQDLKNLRLCVLKTSVNKQYLGFSFQQAELYLLKTLADSNNNQSSRLNQQLIFYPEFIREIILDMRAFMNEKNHMMKVDVRYGGRKTGLKCAFLASTGKTNLSFIDFNSKIGWQKEIIKYVTSSFIQTFQNSYYCLAFNTNAAMSEDYLEVISEFLINCESKRLLCFNSKGKEKDDEEQKQPVTILQHLKVHSFFSRKYQQFVEFCKKKLKIVIIINRRRLNQILNLSPVFLKACSIINLNEEKYEVSGVIYRSLGAVWNGMSPTNFLSIHNKDNTEIQKISKSIAHVEQQLLSKLGVGNRKHKFIEWMSSSMHYFLVSKQKIQKQIDDIRKVMTKKEQIVLAKEKIQKELSLLIPKHAKVNKKNSSILVEVKQFEQIYLKKKRIFDEEAEIVAMKRKKAEDIQLQCEQDLGKVTPVLQSAQQSLAKVTRDDINQLRSFPNPPLSAAKVVEALCFVFNQDHLVKQKVENGVKFKDYWDYAKKFILNDRLLKRVTEFKPDYIKTMNRAKMEVLKVITRQPQLKQQRVFKASSAAGNLSVWMRAVVLTFEVMEIIEPKKKLLNQAIQDLKANEQILEKMKEDMNEAQKQFIKKSQFYQGQMTIEKEMQAKIEEIKSIIKRSQQFISLLERMQREWDNKINVALPNEIQKCKRTCIIIGLHMTYLSELSYEQRKSSKLLIYQALGLSNFELVQDPISQNYLSILLNTPGVYNIIAPHYSQNIVVTLQKVQKSKKNLIIYDQTHTLLPVILQFVDKYLKQMYSRVRIIDCLELNEQTQIYDRIQSLCKTDENKSLVQQQNITQNSSSLIILLHVEQLSIHQVWEYTRGQFPNCRIITIVRQQMQDINLQFDVVNQLNQQTKQALINSVIYPIHKTNTMLNTSFNKHIHQQNVATYFRSMIQILSNNQEILLSAQSIHQWTSSYHSYWTGITNEVTIKNMSQIQKQGIKMLSQSQYWVQYTTFSDFLNIVKATLKRNQKQTVYSLNEKLKEKFQSSAKSLFNINTHTSIKKQTHQIQPNQLGLLRKRSEEEQLFSFNPITLIELQNDEDSEKSSNIILQFLQARRAEKANNGTALQINQIVYMPSKEKALLNVSYLIQNGKQVVICCKNKFQAYKIYEKIKLAYDQFCQKMSDINDQFSCQGFPFRAHILVTSSKKLLRNRERLIVSWDKEKKLSAKIGQFNLASQLRGIGSNLTKAEKQYSQSLIRVHINQQLSQPIKPK